MCLKEYPYGVKKPPRDMLDCLAEAVEAQHGMGWELIPGSGAGTPCSSAVAGPALTAGSNCCSASSVEAGASASASLGPLLGGGASWSSCDADFRRFPPDTPPADELAQAVVSPPP
jgi:hypothetical protein